MLVCCFSSDYFKWVWSGCGHKVTPLLKSLRTPLCRAIFCQVERTQTEDLKTNKNINQMTSVAEDLAPLVEDLAPLVEDLAPLVEDLAPLVEDLAPLVEDLAPLVADINDINFGAVVGTTELLLHLPLSEIFVCRIKLRFTFLERLLCLHS